VQVFRSQAELITLKFDGRPSIKAEVFLTFLLYIQRYILRLEVPVGPEERGDQSSETRACF
jgi:hypothetical protein